MDQVDAIIIGTGQGGVPLATTLASEGKRVVIFERSRFGGSCVNWGCTPSKAFLAAAHAAGRARAAEALGIHAEVAVNFPEVMERVRGVRDSFTQGSEKRLKQAELTVVEAEASLTEEGRVQGGGKSFAAPLVVINTGTSALIPPIPGLAGTPYLTDHTFWGLTALPPRTLVLGAGYIGLELGQGLARLGSRVTLIDQNTRVLASESPRVSEALKEALAHDGVSFQLGQEVASVAHDGVFRVELKGGATLEGEALLIATGRRPNTEALEAEAAGIELDDKGFIKTNDHFATTRKGVYAIGDVTGQPAFTHVSWEDYRRLLAILKGEDRSRGDRVLGYAVFTAPQVGRAGLSLEQAEAQGLEAREVSMKVESMARAIEWGHELGFYQMVVDEDSGSILGATLVGYEAAELVHVFLDLMEAGADWSVLERAQNIHPTYAENLPSLARMLKD